MKFSFNSFVPKLTMAAAVAATLAGCGEPEYPTPTPISSANVAQASVLVVNAAPGTRGITATLENLPFGTTIPYLGTFVPTYTPIQSGLRLFVFNDPANIPATPTVPPPPAPQPATTPLPVITSPRTLLARATYAVGTNYTVFLTDPPTRAYAYLITATSDQGGIRTLTLIDDLAAPTVATNAKIRFVNLAPTATGGNTTYGIYNSTTAASLFSTVPLRAYRALSVTTPVAANYANFTEVAAGSYTLDVRSVATAAIAGTQQVVTLAPGKIYTLYTRGISNGAANNGPTPLGISVVTHN